ncbi:MAG: toprim domain-containing protein, partial [Anaerotardibacter sp.]
YTDVIAMHEAGITNTVATLGTALTRQHIRILSHHAKQKIVYLFDGDEAGQRACERALEFIDDSVTPEHSSGNADLYALTLPNNLDPCEYLETYGADDMRALLDTAVPLIKFGIDRKIAGYDLFSPEGQGRAVIAALQVLAPIKDSLLAQNYAVYIASQTHMQESAVLSQLSRLKAPAAARESYPQPTQAPVTQKRSKQLSVAEKNRLKNEREFLALCAQNPAMIGDFANELGQTNWHENIHRDLADVLLDVCVEKPNATVAEVLDYAQQRNPYAMKVLTAAVTGDYHGAYEYLRFIADELSIGDLSDTITTMRLSLKNNASMSEEERDWYFQSIVALQENLRNLRARHDLTE